jgi:hypothetical protein
MANLSYGLLSYEQWTHRRSPDGRSPSVGYLGCHAGSVVEVAAPDKGSGCGLADCGLPLSVLVRRLTVQARRGRLTGGGVKKDEY